MGEIRPSSAASSEVKPCSPAARWSSTPPQHPVASSRVKRISASNPAGRINSRQRSLSTGSSTTSWRMPTRVRELARSRIFAEVVDDEFVVEPGCTDCGLERLYDAVGEKVGRRVHGQPRRRVVGDDRTDPSGDSGEESLFRGCLGHEASDPTVEPIGPIGCERHLFLLSVTKNLRRRSRPEHPSNGGFRRVRSPSANPSSGSNGARSEVDSRASTNGPEKPSLLSPTPRDDASRRKQSRADQGSALPRHTEMQRQEGNTDARPGREPGLQLVQLPAW